MPRHLVATIAAVVALTTLAASCGGSESASTDSGTEVETGTGTTPTDSPTDPGATTTGDDDAGADEAAGAASDGQPDPVDDDDEGQPDGREPQADGGEPGADQHDGDDETVITGSLAGGEVTVTDRRFEVTEGSTVRIAFESDQAEHIHVHGYDLMLDLVPGQPDELTFVADSPGTFEVELEVSGRFLFDLLVR